jgi:hypothetical protein
VYVSRSVSELVSSSNSGSVDNLSAKPDLNLVSAWVQWLRYAKDSVYIYVSTSNNYVAVYYRGGYSVAF